MTERTRRTPAQRQAPTSKNPATMRLFIAVPIPEPIVEFTASIITNLQKENWPVRWAQPDNAHITLHFLGQISQEQSELLRFALHQPVSTQPGFDLRTANLGVFPNMKRPRVLWLGLYGPAHRLHTLHEELGSLLKELDFDLAESGEFHPHITLGRLRNAGNQGKDLALRIRTRFEVMTERGMVTDKEPMPFPVREVHLVRSHLSAAGAQYEILERFPLAEPII